MLLEFKLYFFIFFIAYSLTYFYSHFAWEIMVNFALRLMSTCWLLSASITMAYTHTLYGQRPEIIHNLKLYISLNCKSWLHGKFMASKVCYTVLLKVSTIVWMRMVPIGYLNACFPVGGLLGRARRYGLEDVLLAVGLKVSKAHIRPAFCLLIRM